MEPVGHHGQNDPFSRLNEPHSKQIRHFVDFSYAIVHGILLIQNFVTSFNTLAMEPIGPDDQIGPF
ncbi:hypothetical protein H5410_031962 [Solanum commersonii]|uniref:Uncharacterized protein n=1 Tax=Solanum commersonii TaxID=4109 RepID=A0A9J5YLN0_SOLCO|nr:hypothetical protein H5410_031962 [Solanum commersonii]